MTKLTEKQTEQMDSAWEVYWGCEIKPQLIFPLFKEGYTAAVNRECVWKLEGRHQWYGPMYKPACGASPSMWSANFCPNCGGKVVEENEKAQEALKAAEEVE